MEQTLELSSEKKQDGSRKGCVKINAEQCKGCYLCIEACPKDLIEVAKCLNGAGYYPAVATENDACSGCGLCWQVCPDVAIEVYRADKGSDT